jgi:hypothetical protein
MKIKFLLTTSIYLLALVIKAFAQEDSSKFKNYDYVVNLNNDTIRCKIKFRKFTTAFQSARKAANGRIKYQVAGVSGSKNVDADSIKAYYLARDSSFYLSEYLPGTDYRVFVKLLQRGKINLYEFSLSVGAATMRQANGSFITTANQKNSYWYVNKDNDPLRELKATTIFTDESRKERKKMFSEMIADDEPLKAQFEADSDFGLERLRYYIRQYNQHQTGEVQVTGK